MLPFFRKIRWRLARDNQFFKYSRYAIGEIILVVIGILIALQVNNWNEKEKILKIEKEILEEIKSGLEQDLKDITQLRDAHNSFINSQKKIIDWIENKRDYSDSLVPSFKFTTWILWFSPKRTQLEALRQFGFVNISNKKLRIQITDLYDVTYMNLGLWQEEIRHKTLNFQEKYGEHGFEFSKYKPDESFELIPLNPTLLQSNKEYLFDLRMNYESMNIYTNTELAKGKVEIEKTIAMIKKELNQ